MQALHVVIKHQSKAQWCVCHLELVCGDCQLGALDGGQCRSVTCAGDCIYTGAMVLNNGTGATLDCQDASHLADDILWRCPPGHLTGQPYTDHLHSSMPWL